MDPESWKLAKELIAGALKLPESDRAPFLFERCADPQIRAEILELLQHAGASLQVDPLFSELFPAGAASSLHTPAEPLATAWTGELPDRFRPLRKLGSGSFGDVYQVFDETTQSELALKVLRNVTALTLYQFKQEFRKLVAVRHANVARLYELICAHGTWMFTMEFVDAVAFNKYVGRSSDSAKVRGALRQLIEGVKALHDHGLLHRDLKPSNVLVSRTGRVVIVDFGLVRDLQVFHSQNTLSMGGTPVYMAPEQLTRATLTNAADWYAVGVMLYETLTGRVPFEGALLDVIEGKLAEDAVPPSHLVDAVPPDLEELCLGFLAREPSRRLTGGDALARLEERTGQAEAPASASSAARTVDFVGRKSELSLVQSAFDSVCNATPRLIHIVGPSGIGKSAFVQHFVDTAQRSSPDLVVLFGRCHATESVPFQGLDQVVDELVKHLRRLSLNDLERVLPRNFALLARVFPVLAQLDTGSGRSAEIVDPTELRSRVFSALRELLGRIAERQPVIVAVDDLQWADDDALVALRELVTPPAAPALLILLAYRSDDAQRIQSRLPANGDGATGTRVASDTVILKGLNPSETTALVLGSAGHAGPIDSRSVEAIVAGAEGSPFLALELVRGAAEAGGVTLSPSGEMSVERTLAHRLDRLSADERRYLEFVSLAGGPVQIGVIDAAVSIRSAFAIRSELAGRRLIRAAGGMRADSIETYHDRIRDVVVSLIPSDRSREYHSRLATALDRATSDDPERVAFHREHAGELSTAVAHALLAARAATAALAFGKAARCYQQALKLGVEDHGERRSALTELGDALSNAGHGSEAALAYLEASALTAGDAQLQLQSKAAAQYLRSGHLREGVDLFETVLDRVGIRVPANRKLILLRILIERIRLRLTVRKLTPPPDVDRLAHRFFEADACARAAAGFSMVDPLRSAFFSTRFVRLALGLGEPRRLCLALAGEATQLCHTPRRIPAERVAQLLTQATDLAERLDDPYPRAFVTVMAGCVAYFEGRWRKARELTDRAIEMLHASCTGVAWELSTAQTLGFVCRFVLGEWNENARRMPALVREAQARGDRFAHYSLRVLGCAYLTDLAADAPAKAQRDLAEDLARWSYRDYDIQQAQATVASVDIALYEDSPERAVSVLRSEWPAIVRSQLLRIPTTFTFSYTARARALLALAAREGVDPLVRDSLLKEAADVARIMRKKGPSWCDGLATLFAAGVAASRGDRETATRMLMEANIALDAAAMVPFVMAVRWRLAKLCDPADARALEASVEKWASSQNIKRPERILAGLAPGRWHS